MTGKMIKNNRKKRGFSIVELLITGFIFSVIFGVATSTFVNAIRVQRYNMAHQQVLNQAGYAIEYITRALRMAQKGEGICIPVGTSYQVISSGREIKFRDYKGDCKGFRWENGQFFRVGFGESGDELAYPAGTDLVFPDDGVVDSKFEIQGERDNDNLQPRVTIFMEFQDYRLARNIPRVSIQATVSQRNLDE